MGGREDNSTFLQTSQFTFDLIHQISVTATSAGKMKTTMLYLQLMLICQAVTSCYGAYQSYVAITNLRKYEETTKKLAKWSSEVEYQLHKTRTTQASGAVAVRRSVLRFPYMPY